MTNEQKMFLQSQKPEASKQEKEYNPFGKKEIDRYFDLLCEDNPSWKDLSAEEIIKSDLGWKKLTEDFLENNYSDEFDSEQLPYKADPEADEYDVDSFQNIKRLIVSLFFKYNPEKAREFFANYLKSLYKRRRQEWNQREMWVDHSQYEPNDFSEGERWRQEYAESIKEARDDSNLQGSNGLEHDIRLDMEETHEIFGKLTSTVLKEFAKSGDKKDIVRIIEYIENDFYSRYHLKEIAECFKSIDKKFACDFIGTAIGGRGIEQAKVFLALLLELEPVEDVRERINEQLDHINSGIGGYVQKKFINPEMKKVLAELRAMITPNHDKIAIENLQKFYQEKIKFEDYDINKKMNAKDIALLHELIGKDEKILEEGSGTGRLLLEMKKAGYDITGFDFTERHAEITKKQDNETKILRGNWHNLAFADESFDTIYSLGRNILHDYSIVDQVQLFREANRVLKPGGQFIFDIPNRDKGEYKKRVDDYKDFMKEMGIKNYRNGAVYDSPDGVSFTTRYAYSEEDIAQLAQLTGFKITQVRKEELETGKGDENLYFVLEKI